VDEESESLRREIVDDIGALLREQLAADAWGRVLVEVVRDLTGEPIVAGMEVEEIVGDEARVDEVFDGPEARALLPAIAKATEALAAIDDVALEDVHGGTFVRLEQGFAWLPGLVHAPSPRLDRERDALVARLREKNEALRARIASDRVELDVEAATLRWLTGDRVVGEARATLLGTFAQAPRTWGWAWSNPTVSEVARRASSALTDAIPERDIWEITTPVFATDEPTAWAIAALVCDRAAGDGVQRIAQQGGALFVLVSEVSAPGDGVPPTTRSAG
jgi:hypothetical protein